MPAGAGLTGEGLLPALVEVRLPWTSTAIRRWYPEDTLREHLRAGLAVEAGRADDLAFGASFREHLGLDVGGPAEWANRVVDLPDGGWALTGIRFRRLDVRRPFVDVVATTAPPTADGLALLAQALPPAYAPFAPLCLRVNAPDAPALVAAAGADPRFGPWTAVDQHLVAGLVTDLRAHPRAAAYGAVTLRPGGAAALARRTAGIYAELAASASESTTWASPEDAGSLAGCAEAGLLFEVLVDGEPAGVVAAVRDDVHGLAGFGVQELCLDRRHRGRRLAAAAVQRLVDALPAAPGDTLWGTIHPDNVASLRNALAVGRRLVGGYVWVTPRGRPGMPSARPADGPPTASGPV